MNRQEKGIYILVMQLRASQDISVGRHPLTLFKRGIYLYVGKARNGLKGRIERHLRKSKKLHWHIDFFLKKADIREVWVKPDSFDECGTAKKIEKQLVDSFVPLKRFGSSDCRCPGHLLFATGEKSELSHLREKLSFKKVNTHGYSA